ncbi:MAG: gfo/Idh/MocA family oxidoreductase [Gemmataceae bacterium]|nr:gfo/Idh/MocA family oxidoreductase [Gemmataceae bacterium]
MARFTRRTFLKSAAAAAAAPAVWVRPARAAAANDRLTLGFIGVGTMGRGHLGGFLGRNEVEVVAVCDVVKERLDNAARAVEKKYADRIKSGVYKGVKAYPDFRQLLDHPGLDAVVIATPDHWHAMPCILAARAGKHIYCEKPLTHNVAEGRRIVAEVKKAKVVFQTGSQQRSEFDGHFRKAVEYVWNGRIGTLKTVRIGVGGPARLCDLPAQDAPEGTDWDFWLGPAPDRAYHSDLCPKGVHGHFPAWRLYQEYAGGQVADMGAHHFDIAQWAMRMDGSGPVGVIPPADPKTGRGLRFVYASGVVMIHNEFEKGPDGKDVRADCVFEGTDGTILVGRGGISSLPDKILKDPLGARDEKVYPAMSHHGNWLECVKTGKETICPAETGHRSATICHLGNIGYRLGRELKWDPAKEQFVGDAGANKELTREPRAKWKLV